MSAKRFITRNSTSEMAVITEVELLIRSAEGSSENMPDDSQDKGTVGHSTTMNHNNNNNNANNNINKNDNHISLSALKCGAADIGSWDDNWKSVLSPLVKSWIR